VSWEKRTQLNLYGYIEPIATVNPRQRLAQIYRKFPFVSRSLSKQPWRKQGLLYKTGQLNQHIAQKIRNFNNTNTLPTIWINWVMPSCHRSQCPVRFLHVIYIIGPGRARGAWPHQQRKHWRHVKSCLHFSIGYYPAKVLHGSKFFGPTRRNFRPARPRPGSRNSSNSNMCYDNNGFSRLVCDQICRRPTVWKEE